MTKVIYLNKNNKRILERIPRNSNIALIRCAKFEYNFTSSQTCTTGHLYTIGTVEIKKIQLYCRLYCQLYHTAISHNYIAYNCFIFQFYFLIL